MGKRKAKNTSESSQKRRSPRFLEKQEATELKGRKPRVHQSTESKSAFEPKTPPEVQRSTEDKVNTSSASEPPVSPEIQTSMKAKIDASSASEPTVSANVEESTEVQQHEVPVDEHGLPELPEERRPGKSIVWTRPRSLSYRGEWNEGCTKNLFHDFSRRVSTWVNKYCYRRAKLRDRLSAGDLQLILDSLGNFCLDKDWKSIEARLDELGYNNFWYFLPGTVLMKHLFEDVISNPFVYVEGSQEGTDSQSSMDPPAFGKELWGLWKRLIKVDPIRASDWRRTTTQLLNQVHPEHTRDYRVAHQTGKAQELLANRLATSMLKECQALQVVLKKMTDSNQVTNRYEGLVDIYRSAIDISIYLGTIETEFEFELDVRRCGPFLHRKTRVRKRGCSDEIQPDEWPIPILLHFPLVSSRHLITSDVMDTLQQRREHFEYDHRDDGEEELRKQLDKEIPQVEEGDTILDSAISFADIVYSKDGPQACSCGGRFVCQGGCKGDIDGDDDDDDDDENSDSNSKVDD
ncbi:hypothetical protein BO83DRAFT_463796 [Aspergillus eucalypticola CBS 122712]|uniref:Uncharacterized protein n=1 Tax=Aspergillus eucalypticola (strain CBS 122712 / IBT 29274) TaxID=1448314 RepID=A0A317VSR9_ASPEC|nr:uncharacterized protein BO83DRAFT_463796 [Aspergillus eucalypticola CBS 122712]PWY75972.1 hypothetical protein BO83DRAFT_463796 [Aspergillus eucalypticola CBS 122712]